MVITPKDMAKKLSMLVLLASTFPQTALAHFEASHTPFWQEPMHWLVQHYLVISLIGLGIIGIVVYLKKAQKEDSK